MKNIIITILPILFLAFSIQAQDDLMASVTTTNNPDPVSKNASFEGESANAVSFIAENFKYPVEANEAGISGKMEVRLLINEDGTPQFYSISGIESQSIEKELTNVVSEMPKWEPASKNGKAIKQVVKFTMDLRLD